jgi:hypothetical protein
MAEKIEAGGPQIKLELRPVPGVTDQGDWPRYTVSLCVQLGSQAVLRFSLDDVVELLEMAYYARSGRCMACGWALAAQRDETSIACIPGTCRFHPVPDHPAYPKWHSRMELLEKARIFAGSELFKQMAANYNNAENVREAAMGDR